MTRPPRHRTPDFRRRRGRTRAPTGARAAPAEIDAHGARDTARLSGNCFALAEGAGPSSTDRPTIRVPFKGGHEKGRDGCGRGNVRCSDTTGRTMVAGSPTPGGHHGPLTASTRIPS